MSQGAYNVPAGGSISMVAFATLMNTAYDALATQNSGAGTPANGPDSAPLEFQAWFDTTSVNFPIFKFFDGVNWPRVGTLDVANSNWLPKLGGGTATLASASTVNLGASPQTFITISGSASINSFGSAATVGEMRFILASGAFTLVNSANIICPNSASVTVSAGDSFIAAYNGAGQWQILGYVKPKSTVINVNDFGAVGNGVTDDTTALTNFFSALIATPGTIGVIPAKTYAITSALPTINTTGVIVVGAGPAGSHNIGPLDVGAVIKWTGGAGGTMLTIAPTAGAGNAAITGIQLKGITFDANSLAAKGVVINSVHYSDFDFTVLNATSTGLELGVVNPLGEFPSLQMNRFRYTSRQIEAAGGIPLVLKGDTTGNVSFNWFEMIDLVHTNTVAAQVQNADNNMWGLVRTQKAGGGAAVNAIEWDGAAATNTRARAEQFLKLSGDLPSIAKGTGTFAFGAANIKIFNLDKENGTPVPTVETGASLYYQNDNTPIYPGTWVTYVPVITAGSGTFTTVSATGSYLQSAHKVDVQIVITITTNGSAAGTVKATLPFTAGGGASDVLAATDTTTAFALTGFITNNATQVVISKYDGTYPGGTGKVIVISGSYEVD